MCTNTSELQRNCHHHKNNIKLFYDSCGLRKSVTAGFPRRSGDSDTHAGSKDCGPACPCGTTSKRDWLTSHNPAKATIRHRLCHDSQLIKVVAASFVRTCAGPLPFSLPIPSEPPTTTPVFRLFFFAFSVCAFLPVYIYAAFSANECTPDFGQTLLLLLLSLVARPLLILNLCTDNGQ